MALSLGVVTSLASLCGTNDTQAAHFAGTFLRNSGNSERPLGKLPREFLEAFDQAQIADVVASHHCRYHRSRGYVVRSQYSSGVGTM